MLGLRRGLAVVLWLAGTSTATADDGIEFFEKRVRPILASRCAACHGEQLQTAGLNLVTAEGFFRGGDSGPVFEEGAPDSSRLIEAVRYEGRIKMPPTGMLPEVEIRALTLWVRAGAPWPDARVGPADRDPVAAREWSKEQTAHWAFQPIATSRPPAVEDPEWVQTPIDRYILSRLAEEGLSPAPRADRITLLRRAKYDLHGLPPTEAEVAGFLADTAPGAFGRLVDRLLGSPRYGEKWGRHWLDVARYADSTGLDDDIKVPHTWRYRDYVIDALNRDTPFDRFIVEQLAGDLLPPEGGEEVNRRGVIATGFLAVGTKALVQQDKIKMKYDVVDEQIDTTAKVFMGLTMGCARCHDHKFDPISAVDYYSMASIFASVRNFESLDPDLTVSKVHLEPLVPQGEYRQYRDHQDRTRNTKRRIESILGLETLRYILKNRSQDLARYMVAAHEVYSDGADADIVADREGLDCEVLRLWTDYLRPTDELRLHLRQWHEADGPDRGTVAAQYQGRYISRGQQWIGELARWRQEIKGWNRKDEFPEKPDLAPGADRFFAEVSLAAGAMDEGAEGADGPFAVPEKSVDLILPKASLARVEALREELEGLEEAAPPRPPMAYAVAQGESGPQHVFLRGDHNSPGAPVRKQFPVILAGQDQPPIAGRSGRLELARWLASPHHPLTGRVLANRLWQWHFGQGLVRTPNNFGLTGERPTHPALLDYLARRLRSDGWSWKAMHRLIMLSSTYQMQSAVSGEAWEKDPSNRLWSRFSRRRLAVEEMRDSLLALDGALDLGVGGPLTESLNSYGFEEAYLHPDDTRRRTVYLPIYRNRMPTLLTLFDFADPSTSIAVRPKTSVAPQGLYFMNSDFVHERATALARRLLEGDAPTDADRVERAISIALTRMPEAREVQEMMGYIDGFPVPEGVSDARLARWQSFCRLLLGSNEFSYVN